MLEEQIAMMAAAPGDGNNQALVNQIRALNERVRGADQQNFELHNRLMEANRQIDELRRNQVTNITQTNYSGTAVAANNRGNLENRGPGGNYLGTGGVNQNNQSRVETTTVTTEYVHVNDGAGGQLSRVAGNEGPEDEDPPNTQSVNRVIRKKQVQFDPQNTTHMYQYESGGPDAGEFATNSTTTRKVNTTFINNVSNVDASGLSFGQNSDNGASPVTFAGSNQGSRGTSDPSQSHNHTTTVQETRYEYYIDETGQQQRRPVVSNSSDNSTVTNIKKVTYVHQGQDQSAAYQGGSFGDLNDLDRNAALSQQRQSNQVSNTTNTSTTVIRNNVVDERTNNFTGQGHAGRNDQNHGSNNNTNISHTTITRTHNQEIGVNQDGVRNDQRDSVSNNNYSSTSINRTVIMDNQQQNFGAHGSTDPSKLNITAVTSNTVTSPGVNVVETHHTMVNSQSLVQPKQRHSPSRLPDNPPAFPTHVLEPSFVRQTIIQEQPTVREEKITENPEHATKLESLLAKKQREIDDLLMRVFLLAAENDRLRNEDQLLQNIRVIRNSPLVQRSLEANKAAREQDAVNHESNTYHSITKVIPAVNTVGGVSGQQAGHDHRVSYTTHEVRASVAGSAASPGYNPWHAEQAYENKDNSDIHLYQRYQRNNKDVEEVYEKHGLTKELSSSKPNPHRAAIATRIEETYGLAQSTLPAHELRKTELDDYFKKLNQKLMSTDSNQVILERVASPERDPRLDSQLGATVLAAEHS